MQVFGIHDVVYMATEEMLMAPSPGKKYINYDYYDPDWLQQLQSENFEADVSAAAVQVVVATEEIPPADELAVASQNECIL